MKKISIFAASLMCSMMLSAQTRETAVLFSGTELDESYLLADNVSIVFDNSGNTAIYSGTAKVRELDITNKVTIEFKDAFTLTANQDPNHQANYYSTFYTGDCAYKVPTETKAYAGNVESGEKTDVLKLADVGSIIHQGEPVILRVTGSNIVLMPSCNKADASTPNILLGTDEETTLGENDYALSYGSNGVGFYLWDGLKIDAHKAYLTLPSSAKAFTFDFDDGTATGIKTIDNGQLTIDNSKTYNLNGIRVGKNYKGIVIKNGKKIYQK